MLDINVDKFQQCKMTVMDNIADPFILFDDKGISNYYYEYKELEAKNVFNGKEGKEKLEQIISKIKSDGAGKKYDCITGISGGVDSTYLVLLAKKMGLNVLLVHFDNGWNSELAVNNIQNIISKSGFDLHTLVVNWDEFKDIQLSYFKANVVDIEAITDHAITSTLYKLANKYNIKYILSGNNTVTEGILPKFWIFDKGDSTNIKDIHKTFGTRPIKTYPLLSSYKKKYYTNVKGIEVVQILDYVEYNKKNVKETITRDFDWRDYGGKHYESIFTRFYQGYILPAKFGIDKRKAHLSTLICSGQINKAAALAELENPIYDEKVFLADKEFVLKKLGLNEDDFEKYIESPRIEHIEYKHDKGIWDDLPFTKPFKPLWQYIKKYRNK